MYRQLTLLLISFFLIPETASVAVQPIPLTPEFVTLDSGSQFGQQGFSVDVSGNLAILGAPSKSGGSAFVFDVTSGELVHELRPSDISRDALYGLSAAIDGDLAVVAAGQRNAAYVFDVSSGQLLHKITPVGPPNFVRSVAISDGLAVLGTPTFEIDGRDYGATFVYDARSGSLLYRLNGPTSFFKRNFGSRVAIDENTLAVVSPGELTRNEISVFDAQTGQFRWSYGYSSQVDQFLPNDIAIDGDLIALGARMSGDDIAEVIVLDRSSGELINRIDTRVENENDDYKREIDISGDRLAVGSWGTFEEGIGYYVGSVSLFDINSGDYLGGIPNPTPNVEDIFGYSISLDGDRLIVGAPGENEGLGLVYSFHLVPEPSTFSCLLSIVSLAGPMRLRCTRPSSRKLTSVGPRMTPGSPRA